MALAAKSLILKDGETEIIWDIQSDGEYLEWCEIKSDEEMRKKHTELSDETNLND